jgi:hypothetical protein
MILTAIIIFGALALVWYLSPTNPTKPNDDWNHYNDMNN